MARMIPQTVVASDTSGSERRVFSLLKNSLPDEYVVLHNISWLVRASAHRPTDGQADFLVTHPELGLLVLEVKGGVVRFSAQTGQWFTTPSGQSERTLKESPFDQAKRNMYALRDLLRDAPNWKREWELLGRSVCFPDGVFRQRLPVDDEQSVLLTSEHCSDPAGFAQRIEEIMRWWRSPRASFSKAAQQFVVDLLAQDVEVRQPLGAVVHETDEQIISLSEQQYRVLDLLSRNRRVQVSGPAGSGKTLLAVEKATRLARQGAKVLVTCFNRPLADFLSSTLQNNDSIAPDQRSRLKVANFHSLSFELCRQAGIRNWTESQAGELLFNAVDLVGPRFDAIVVDEGQDFEADWWMPISMLLTDPDDGILYVFYDSNQKIYRRPEELPEGLVPIPLNESWRNTEEIFHSVNEFYSGDEVRCMGPRGPEVQMEDMDDYTNVRQLLSRVLHRLVEEEELQPKDIVVLTTDAGLREELAGRVGAFVLSKTPEGPRDVHLESVHRFKGLDAPAVLLVDAGIATREEQDKLLYVGCSRARSFLVVCARQDVLNRLGPGAKGAKPS